jgi:hypothetical protein
MTNVPGFSGSSTRRVSGWLQKWKPSIAVHTDAPAMQRSTPSEGRPTLQTAVPPEVSNRVGIVHARGAMLSMLPSQLSSCPLHVSAMGPIDVHVMAPNALHAVTVPRLHRPCWPGTVHDAPIAGHRTLHTPLRSSRPAQH